MQLYNSMTRKKEEFVPLNEGQVGIYVCGPTVYNLIHIGNARPLVVYDTLRRYLEYRGFKVTFVQNFTDVDDKMIKRANEENCTVADIADKYIPEYYNDSHALHVSDATICPRATQHIPEIIELISELINAGHAYISNNGDVYFSVRSYKNYGKLSGQSIEALESGARVDPTDNKKDPLDFALWKAEKPGEPSWDSPWGKGRPGWHIECSAMSMKVLGKTFDIHAGGIDLLFPHHENEIAQSEAATGVPFARYWLHNGHININNQKMSKSLGNFFWVRDILKDFEPDALRLFFLIAHYRSPLNFSRELMEQAQNALERIRTAKTRISTAISSDSYDVEAERIFMNSINEYRLRFIAAMDDDINTADALAVLFEFIRNANTYVTVPQSKASIDAANAFLLEIADVLGISTDAEEIALPSEVQRLLDERTIARKTKDWTRADAIREELKSMGFVVEDSPQGPTLKRI